MFEFHYCIDLVIVHPSFDPMVITERITELRPVIETKAGDESIDVRGQPLGRKARLSVWSAALRDAKRIWSATTPIFQFIEDRLTVLEPHREFLRDLNREAYVVLRIGWFSESSHSASCLEWDTIRKCAEFGLGIELNYYATDDEDNKVARPTQGGSRGDRV